MSVDRRDVLLKGGRLLDPSTRTDAVGDILLRDGKIESIGGNLNAPDGATILQAPYVAKALQVPSQMLTSGCEKPESLVALYIGSIS